MSLSRRHFVAATAAAALTSTMRAASARTAVSRRAPHERFDPWIEVDPSALRHNVGVLSRLAGGRPILAVVKNNAYGLGIKTVGPVLDAIPEVQGLAVVKTAEAIALRDAGVRKPVLLMALFADADGPELMARDITLALCTDDGVDRVARAAAGRTAPVPVHAYLDTGMSRLGVPYHRALPWLAEVASDGRVSLQGTMMGFTEDRVYDREQLRRFNALGVEARQRGIDLGAMHAASSDAVFNFPDSHLDLIRPGISLYGAYPSNEGREHTIAELRAALRLRARVVRVEQLRVGDSVSYGRNYIAERPTWIATVPIGHADGLPRRTVDGGRVLINGRTYPAIGAVSASHTIVEVGDERTVEIGDPATVIGPDHPDIAPNALATRAGVSVYDILMHLNPDLPKVVA